MDLALLITLGFVFSVIILIISMVLTSSLMGGVDFGAVHIVVLKAIPLLIAVNLLAAIPYGIYLAIPVWWIGLMILFRLDFWEVRTLVVVNWALNFIVRLILISLLK